MERVQNDGRATQSRWLKDRMQDGTSLIEHNSAGIKKYSQPENVLYEENP